MILNVSPAKNLLVLSSTINESGVCTSMHNVKKSQKILHYYEEQSPLFFTYSNQNVQRTSNSTYDILLNKWNDGSNSILNKLSKLQRRAARVITGQSYEVRSTQILESFNWIPIEETLKKEKQS